MAVTPEEAQQLGVRIITELDVMGGHIDSPLVRWRMILYTVDSSGPYLIEGPAEDLPPEEIRRRLAVERDKVRALIGPHDIR